MKRGKLSRVLARLLVFVMLTANLSDVWMSTAYAAGPGYEEKGTELQVCITQEEIESVLSLDAGDRPTLDEDLIPFTGGKLEKTKNFLHEFLKNQILVAQDGDGYHMYLITVEKADGQDQKTLVDRVNMIGINGDEEEDCNFTLQLVSDRIYVYQAKVSRYEVVQAEKTEMEELLKQEESKPVKEDKTTGTATPSEVEKASPSDGQKIEENMEPETQETATKSEAAAPVLPMPDETLPQSGPEEEKAAEINGGVAGTETQADDAGSGAESEAVQPEQTADGQTEPSETTDRHSSIAAAGEAVRSDNESGQTGEAVRSEDKSGQTGEAVRSEDKSSQTGEAIRSEDKSSQTEEAVRSGDESSQTEEAVSASREPDSQDSGLGQEEETEKETAALPPQEDKAEQDNGLTDEEEDGIPEEALMDMDLEDDIHAVEIFKSQDTQELTEEALHQLNGGEEASGFALFNLMSGGADGAGVLAGTSEIVVIRGEAREKGSIFDQVDEIMADSRFPVMEANLSGPAGGGIRAGERFRMDLTYQAYSMQILLYGVPRTAYQKIDEADINLKLPKDIIVDGIGDPVPVEGTDYHQYTIHLSDISVTNEAVPITLVAHTAENQDGTAVNGSKPMGTRYVLPEDALTITNGSFTVADPYGAESGGEASRAYHFTEEGSVEQQALTLVSNDRWTVVQSYQNQQSGSTSGKNYEYVEADPVTGKPAVKVVYDLDVGLKDPGAGAGSSGILTQEAQYFTEGRADFLDFTLTDYLDFQRDGKAIAPVYAEIVRMEGKNGSLYETSDKVTGVTQTELGSAVSISAYTHKGYMGSNYVMVDDQTPYLSQYRVTAYYPCEDFALDFWDERVGNPDIFPVTNKAEISYSLIPGEELRQEETKALTQHIQFPRDGELITLKKQIKKPDGTLLDYNGEHAADYPGYAEFTLEKTEEDGQTVPCQNAKIKVEDGAGAYHYMPLERLIINPVKDPGEEVPVTGPDGSVEIWVEPGHYQITEIHQPDNTKQSQEIWTADTTAGPAAVTCVNETSGVGGVRFAKKGLSLREGENGLVRSEEALLGAVFGIYKDGSLIKEAVSSDGGVVEFFPLSPGEYTVQELFAPAGYIPDATVYHTVVTEDGWASLEGAADNAVTNKKNEGYLSFTKYIQAPDGSYRPLTDPEALKKYDGAFRVQRADSPDSGQWTDVKGAAASLGGDGRFTVALPIYEIKTVGGNAVPDTQKPVYYRVTETIPAGYTAETMSGGITQTVSGDKREVSSAPVSLTGEWDEEPALASGTAIGNIALGRLGLQKNRVTFDKLVEVENPVVKTLKTLFHIDKRYAAAADLDTPESGRTFYLYKQTGDGFVQAAADKALVTNASGVITALDQLYLPVMENGRQIQYYWYEAPKDGDTSESFGYDQPFKKGAEEKRTTGTITLPDGTRKTAAPLIGPFTAAASDAPATAYVYNVEQKIPYWIQKTDKVTGEPVADASYTVSKGGAVYGGYDNNVTGNQEAPIYLERGGIFQIAETGVPAGYQGYVNEEDSRLGNAQQVAVDHGLIGPDSRFEVSTHTITFENQPLPKVQIIKNLIEPGKEPSQPSGIQFQVWKKSDSGSFTPVFDKNGQQRTITANSGREEYLEAGDYYFSEVFQEGSDLADPAWDEALCQSLPTESYELGTNPETGKKTVFYKLSVTLPQTAEEVGTPQTLTVENDKNLGGLTIQKSNKMTGKPINGARIEIYNTDPAARGAKPVTSVVMNGNPVGTITVSGLPVYDKDGNRIPYYVKEGAAPNGFHYGVDPTVFTVRLKAGAIVDTEIQGGKLLFQDVPLVSIESHKYGVNTWESQFYPVSDEIPGIPLALFYKNDSGLIVPVLKDGKPYVAVTSTEKANAVFQGLELDKTYYVIEAYSGDTAYQPPEGKQLLTDSMEGLPESLSRITISEQDIDRYNYSKFDYNDLAKEQKKQILEHPDQPFTIGPVINEKPWVQFRLHKFAEWKAVETTDPKTQPDFVSGGVPYSKTEKLENSPKPLNGAQFTLWSPTDPDGELGSLIENGRLNGDLLTSLGTYETGTRLAADGGGEDGEFMTEILDPGKIYILEETRAPGGYITADDHQYLILLPESMREAGKAFQNLENAQIQVYTSGKTNLVEAENYCDTGYDDGKDPYCANLLLNKWLDVKGDGKDLEPLGGVRFELKIPGTDYVAAELTTGLDNEISAENPEELTGAAMSKTICFSDLEAALTERGLNPGDYITAGAEDGKNYKEIKLELVETYAPNKVESTEDSYEVTLRAYENQTNLNKEYFYDNKTGTGKKLLNVLRQNYPVVVYDYGYQPIDPAQPNHNMLSGDGLTDEDLEARREAGMETVNLKSEFVLQRKTDGGTNWTNYKYNGKTEKFKTEDGSFSFPSGLPRGEYRLGQKYVQPGYFKVYNVNGPFRYFKVAGGAGVTRVSVYNPQLPDLFMKKTPLDETPGLSLGIKFKSTMDQTPRQIINADLSGIYMGARNGSYEISEDPGDNRELTGQYFAASDGFENDDDIKIVTQFKATGGGIGNFTRVKLDTNLMLTQFPGGDPGYGAVMTVKNPRTASLKIKKEDAEEPGKGLGGAVFSLSYMPFRADTDYTVSNTMDVRGNLQLRDEIFESGQKPSQAVLEQLASLPEDSWKEISDTKPTGSDGTVTVAELAPGWYRIQEKEAPDGYTREAACHYTAVVGDMMSGHSYVAVTDDEAVNGAFTNRQKVTLAARKLLDYGSLYQELPPEQRPEPDQVVLELYKGSDETVAASKPVQSETLKRLSGGSWGAIFPGVDQLTDGESYYIKEVVKDSDPWFLEYGRMEGTDENLPVVSEGENQFIKLNGFTSKAPVTVDITNRLGRARILIDKAETGTGRKLDQAEFEVYGALDENGSPSGPPLASSVPGETGGGYVIDMPVTADGPVEVYVAEKTAPPNHILNPAPVPVTVMPGAVVTQDSAGTPLTLYNSPGADITLTKYDNIYTPNNTNGAKPQESDVAFDLYRRAKADPEAGWELVNDSEKPYTPEGTDGRIQFTGLNVAEFEYGLSEREITQGKYQNYTLESIHQELDGEALAEPMAKEIPDGQREIYILRTAKGEALEPGTAYSFNAYCKPSLSLVIRKEAVNHTAPVPEAEFVVKDSRGGVAATLSTKRSQDASVLYSEAQTLLKEGTYTIEETKSLTGGYQMGGNDSRVTSSQTITLPQPDHVPGEPYILTFTNLKVEMGVTLQKETAEGQQPLESLYWGGEKTIDYTLTPAVVNSLPLTSFRLEDTGLSMETLNGSQYEKLDESYTKNQYSFRKLSLDIPTEENYLTDSGSSRAVESGKHISARVTGKNFDGQELLLAEGVVAAEAKKDGDGNDKVWTIRVPEQAGNIASFAVTYYDGELKPHGYDLGQSFNPGQVRAEVGIFKQPGRDAGGKDRKAVRRIINGSVVSMDYREGGATKTIRDGEKTAELPVKEPLAPIIQLSKTYDGDRAVKLGSTINYHLSLTVRTSEDTTLPMVNPVFIDKLPIGVSVDAGKAVTDLPDGISQDGETRVITGNGGRRYLIMKFLGELKPGQTITADYPGLVGNDVINSGMNIDNWFYVTSTDKKEPFGSNEGGASFRTYNEASGNVSWPQQVEELNEAAGKIGLGAGYGYGAASAENLYTSNGSLSILKEVKGDQDDRYYGEDAAGRVSLGKDGTVSYRLTVLNTSEDSVVSKFRIMDILPTDKLARDIGVGGRPRQSAWAVDMKKGDTVSFVKYRGDGAVVENPDMNVYYTKDSANATAKTLKEDQLSSAWIKGDPAGKDASALAFESGSAMSLKPGERLEITFTTHVKNPENQQDEVYRYSVNNFSLSYSYYHEAAGAGTVTQFPIVESNPVKAILVPNRVKTGGRIWIDANDNGVRDPEEEHILTDDFGALLSSESGRGLFSIVLDKQGEDADMASYRIPDGWDGSYLFDGLLPAQPVSEQNLYSKSGQKGGTAWQLQADYRHLVGENPAHYTIRVTQNEAGIRNAVPGLVLKPAKTTMMGEGGSTVWNSDSGKSRRPEELSGRYAHEKLDSNFTVDGSAARSEDFFLWASGEDGSVYDDSKDLGYVPYRNMSLTKQDENGRPVEGARFQIYGPFETREQAVSADLSTAPRVSDELGRDAWTTGADGRLTGMPQLLWYENYLIEESSPAGNYGLEGAEANLEKVPVTGGGSLWLLPDMKETTGGAAPPTAITVVNKPLSGTLNFAKTDGASGELLEGAVFTLTRLKNPQYANVDGAWPSYLKDMEADSSGAEGIADVRVEDQALEFTTAGKTEVMLTGLPYGEYLLAEKKAPENYNPLVDNKQIRVTVTGTTKMIWEKGEDKGKPVEGGRIPNNRSEDYEFSFKKTDNYGRPLAGIRFNIEGPGDYQNGLWNQLTGRKFDRDAMTGLGERESGGDGVIRVSGLPFGDYRITETTPMAEPMGSVYNPHLSPFYLRIHQDGTVALLTKQDGLIPGSSAGGEINLTVENTVKSGVLKLQKRDSEDGRKLSGAEFTLTSGGTAADGAWEGYKRRLITAAPEEAKRLAKGLTILSKDEKEPLKFRLDGTGVLEELPYGTYTLTETKVPDGYLLEEGAAPWSAVFTVDDGHKTADYTGNAAVLNKPRELTVNKIDGYNDRGLSGAYFILQKQGGPEDGRYVRLKDNSFTGWTDDRMAATEFRTEDPDGTAVIKRLPEGNYTLIETRAPSKDYAIASDSNVAVGGKEQAAATVSDARRTARIVVNKASSVNRNQPLAGAVFGVYLTPECSELSRVATITTTSTGRGTTIPLELGTYYVKEVEAPPGYVQTGQVFPVTLSGGEKYETEFVVPGQDGGFYITNDPGRTPPPPPRPGGSGDGGSSETFTPSSTGKMILPTPVPLAVIPEVPQITIIDQDVPLSSRPLPKTGESRTNKKMLLFLTSAFMLMCMSLAGRKKKEKEAEAEDNEEN